MIPSEHTHLPVASGTHPGMKGKNNEDLHGVFAYRLKTKDNASAVLAIVSDGIGGHRAGEVASKIAVDTIRDTVGSSDGANPLVTLSKAVADASAAIFQQAQQNPDQKGMGATCVCAWVIGNRLYTVSIGDSRLYLSRDGQIRRLTTDHTWVQEAVEYGALTPEQARVHPNQHVIRRYLGAPNPPEPDFRLRLDPRENNEQALLNQGTLLQAGDILLLCSDGLTDLVKDEEIQNILGSVPKEEAVKKLINLANERGGHDNITVVILETPSHQPPKTKSRSGLALFGATCLVMVATAIILSLIAAGAYFVYPRLVHKNTPTQTSAIPVATATFSIQFPQATATPQPATATSESIPDIKPDPTQALDTLTPWPTNPPETPIQGRRQGSRNASKYD